MAKARLDKILAASGFGTRKEVKKLIKEGLVTVDGEPAHDPGMHVDPDTQFIAVAGQDVEYRKHLYLMMNKPPGVITATADRSHPTVNGLLDPHLARRVFPVGRLDKDTEGLLLLTDDGKLAHAILSPRRKVEKEYIAVIDGPIGEAEKLAFEQGLVLDDGTLTKPAKLKVLEDGAHPRVAVTLIEGKYHQVKRMFATLGRRVLHLKRIRIGPLVLDEALSPGDYRPLTPDEEAALLALRSASARE